MTLTLTVLRCPDRVAPETRRIEGGELIIGRGPGANWALVDATDKPQISRRHCTVFYVGGGWKVSDQSTNGTYLNHEAEAIGPGERMLRDGDRLRIGAYEIELTITGERDQRGPEIGGGVAFDPFAQSTPFGGNAPFGQSAAPAQKSQFGESIFGPDPFAGGRESSPFGGGASPFGGESAFGGTDNAFGEQPFGEPQSVRLPDDFANELFGSEPPKPPPAQMDHTPAFMDVMNLQQSRPVLPTNWDDFGTSPAAPASPFGSQFSATPAAPVPPAQAIPANWDELDPIVPAAPVAGPAFPAAAIPTNWDEPPPAAQPASPFASPFTPAPAPSVPPPAAVAPPIAAPASSFPEAEPPVQESDRTGVSRAATPIVDKPPAPVIREPPPATQPLAVTPPAREAGAADATLLAAFLRGAGMAGADLSDPTAAMERTGAAFRAFVTGLREVLIARAEVKSAFRIDQTMVRARGNNPPKFAAGDDDALSALLGAGRRTEMTPAAAVTEALRDIRMHELATMSAMQEAVRELLGRIEPAKLRATTESGGIGLAVQRKAKAWELYETEFARLHESLTERFDDAFGRSFARAYEQVMAELLTKGTLR